MPVEYQSPLIQALRAASPAGSNNPGITFYANPQNGAALNFNAAPPRGLAFNPPVLKMPAVTPKKSGGGGGGNDDGSPEIRDTLPVDLTDLVVLPTIDPELPDEPVDPVVDPVVDPEDPVVDPVDPVVDPVDPVVDPDPVGPDPWVGPDDPVAPQTRGTGTPIFVSTLEQDKVKKDGSHWGEGGDQIYSDPDRVGTPYVDPIELIDVPVVNPDTQRLDNDGSGWGKGSDVQEDPYSFGVLMSDMDGLLDVRDQLGDRPSDNYTFGVLQSDEDPISEADLMRLLMEYGG